MEYNLGRRKFRIKAMITQDGIMYHIEFKSLFRWKKLYQVTDTGWGCINDLLQFESISETVDYIRIAFGQYTSIEHH